MEIKVSKNELPFFVKSQKNDAGQIIGFVVCKKLKNGTIKQVKTFKTGRGAINHCHHKNLGHFQRKGFTGFALID